MNKENARTPHSARHRCRLFFEERYHRSAGYDQDPEAMMLPEEAWLVTIMDFKN